MIETQTYGYSRGFSNKITGLIYEWLYLDEDAKSCIKRAYIRACKNSSVHIRIECIIQDYVEDTFKILHGKFKELLKTKSNLRNALMCYRQLAWWNLDDVHYDEIARDLIPDPHKLLR